jgi:hypothetical protein
MLTLFEFSGTATVMLGALGEVVYTDAYIGVDADATPIVPTEEKAIMDIRRAITSRVCFMFHP